jgi:hypothetical protein
VRPVSRGAVFWGAGLVTAGLVVLALQQGILTDDLVNQAVDWWPLILIGAGVAIIFSGALGVVATALAGVLVGILIGGFIGGAASFPSGCGTGDPLPLRPFEDGSLDGAADVEIELDCVTLEVAGGDDDGWIVEADEETADLLDVSSDDGALGVRAKDTVVLGGEHRLHVGVTVPGGAGTNLSTSLNAGDAALDLSDGQWGSLSVEGNAVAIAVDLSAAEADRFDSTLNAASLSLELDRGSQIGSIELRANAGSFEVCVPDDVGLQVTVNENVATGHNLDEAGLTEDGDVWRTPGYDSADSQIEIAFSGNAASFTLNPDGGCS